MITDENEKVNVKGGRYVGKKWFIKLPYKTIETDVNFFDTKMDIAQGSGFAKVSTKTNTEIDYKNITSVTTKRKYSIPNIILAICAVLGAFISSAWAVLIVALAVVWIGSTMSVEIQHSDNVFEIPTEFKFEAEELQTKINTAISQAE